MATTGTWAAAAPTSLPPPPENPSGIEPIPVSIDTVAMIDGSDSGPEDAASVGRLTSNWLADGTLSVEGWIGHGGSERIDPTRTAAWLQGDHLVIAYRYREDPFPLEPSCMCLGFSRLRFVVKGLPLRPARIEYYEGRLQFKGLRPTH